MDDSLVAKESTDDAVTRSENSSADITFSRSGNENKSSDKESSSSEGNDTDADIGPSYDNDTVTEAVYPIGSSFVAQIRVLFDGYFVLDFRIRIFKISSFKLQNAAPFANFHPITPILLQFSI
ncbi:hypothetical protein Tco_0659293 [Tanacetum coccineum]